MEFLEVFCLRMEFRRSQYDVPRGNQSLIRDGFNNRVLCVVYLNLCLCYQNRLLFLGIVLHRIYPDKDVFIVLITSDIVRNRVSGQVTIERVYLLIRNSRDFCLLFHPRLDHPREWLCGRGDLQSTFNLFAAPAYHFYINHPRIFREFYSKSLHRKRGLARFCIWFEVIYFYVDILVLIDDVAICYTE